MRTFYELSGVWILSLSGDRVKETNANFVREFGGYADGSEVVGLHWWDVLALDKADAARNWLHGTSQKPTALYARSGGTRWLRLRAHIGPETGVEKRLILSVEDVTEEREAIERDRMEAEHFHALIQRSSEGISLFDKTSKILYESPSNKRIHGYDPEEMEGRTLISFCHPDDTSRIALRFKHLAEAPGVVETEIVRFRHKAGHYIYLEGTVLNATDDPRLGAMVNNFREVTGRLEAERELRRAKTAAEEAQRLQQHFLTNLSHEFKTPLTLIRGPLAILAEELPVTGRHRNTFELVFRNIDRLDSLLSELVDLARLEAGTFALNVKCHALSAFVRNQAAAFEGLARAKGITLDIPPEMGDDHEVFFDAPKLEKVIGNLLSNALKFSPPRTTVRVSVRALPDDTGGTDGEIAVSVSDQGAGMDANTRARVFERFFQGDAGLARGHEGMGIGMAIAREMIEMHGGALSVESEPGQGSTFTFTLPMGCEHLDPDDIDLIDTPEARPFSVGPCITLPIYPPGEENTEEHQESAITGRRPKLLLVEDNLDMRTYLRLHLDLHYAVTEATHGQAALALLEDAVPDIILSDVMMPHLNGLDLCRRVRAEPRWAKIPVVLLSAKGGVEHRVEGLQVGADDYLAKPFSVAELLHRLRTRVPAHLNAAVEASTEDKPAWVQRLENLVAEKLASPSFKVDGLARGMGLSPRQLQRRIIEYFGITPAALVLERRLSMAKALLDQKQVETLAQAAHAVGLSPSYFSRRFRLRFKPDSGSDTLSVTLARGIN